MSLKIEHLVKITNEDRRSINIKKIFSHDKKIPLIVINDEFYFSSFEDVKTFCDLLMKVSNGHSL